MITNLRVFSRIFSVKKWRKSTVFALPVRTQFCHSSSLFSVSFRYKMLSSCTGRLAVLGCSRETLLKRKRVSELTKKNVTMKKWRCPVPRPGHCFFCIEKEKGREPPCREQPLLLPFAFYFPDSEGELFLYPLLPLVFPWKRILLWQVVRFFSFHAVE